MLRILRGPTPTLVVLSLACLQPLGAGASGGVIDGDASRRGWFAPLQRWLRGERTEPDVAAEIARTAEMYAQRAEDKCRESHHDEEAGLLTEGIVACDRVGHGRTHPAIANLFRRLAIVNVRHGDPWEAERSAERCVEYQIRRIGRKEHPEVDDLCHSLGHEFASLKRWEPALKMWNKCFQIRNATLGMQHPEVACILDHVAGVLAAMGQVDKAIAMTERCLHTRITSLGDHTLTADSYGMLAGLWRNQSDLLKATWCLRKCSGIRDRILGPSHLLACQTHTHLVRLALDRATAAHLAHSSLGELEALRDAFREHLRSLTWVRPGVGSLEDARRAAAGAGGGAAKAVETLTGGGRGTPVAPEWAAWAHDTMSEADVTLARKRGRDRLGDHVSTSDAEKDEDAEAKEAGRAGVEATLTAQRSALSRWFREMTTADPLHSAVALQHQSEEVTRAVAAYLRWVAIGHVKRGARTRALEVLRKAAGHFATIAEEARRAASEVSTPAPRGAPADARRLATASAKAAAAGTLRRALVGESMMLMEISQIYQAENAHDEAIITSGEALGRLNTLAKKEASEGGSTVVPNALESHEGASELLELIGQAQSHLGLAHKQRGDKAVAARHLLAAWRIQARALGETHEDTRATLNHLREAMREARRARARGNGRVLEMVTEEMRRLVGYDKRDDDRWGASSSCQRAGTAPGTTGGAPGFWGEDEVGHELEGLGADLTVTTAMKKELKHMLTDKFDASPGLPGARPSRLVAAARAAAAMCGGAIAARSLAGPLQNFLIRQKLIVFERYSTSPTHTTTAATSTATSTTGTHKSK